MTTSGSLHPDGRQCRGVLDWVNVEPVVAVSLFGLGLDLALSDNLWLDKICQVHFGFSEAVCNALSDGQHPQEEEEVQRLANRYRVYAKLVEHVPGTAMVLVMGGCSDVLDRRVPLLWCHVGFLLMALSSAANVYWWWLPSELLLLNYLLLGAAGGTLVLILGVEAYASAASATRYRTVRLAVLKVVAMVGRTLGAGVALPLFRGGGYKAVFGAQSLAFAAVIVYVLLKLERRPGEVPLQIATQQQHQQCAAVLLTGLKRTLLVVCRASSQGRGRQLLAHMCIIWFLLFSLGSSTFVFFSARTRFQWTYKSFTLWSIIDVTVSCLGPLVVVPALTHTCHARDELLGLLGSFSFMFRNVLLATAPQAWVLYLASAAGFCWEVTGVASRAAASKVVGQQQVGAVFAVLAVGEAVVPILSAVAFTALYTATYNDFPGAVFVLSAFCSVALSCVFMWKMTLHGGESEENDETATTDILPDAPSSLLHFADEGEDSPLQGRHQ